MKVIAKSVIAIAILLSACAPSVAQQESVSSTSLPAGYESCEVDVVNLPVDGTMIESLATTHASLMVPSADCPLPTLYCVYQTSGGGYAGGLSCTPLD